MNTLEFLANSKVIYRRLLSYVRPYKSRFISAILFGIAAGLFNAVLLFTLRRYGLKTFKGDSKGGVDDEFSKIGHKAVVTEAIDQDGYGEIQLDGTFWRATADVAIEKDQRVIVEGEDSNNGLVLKVKPSSTGTEKES